MFSQLERRIIDISYRKKLSHLSSCLGAVGILDRIYQQRKSNEPVVLGNSHAALSLFCCLEKYGFCDAEEMADKHGTHASRDMEHGVWVSGGSLGQAESLALGYAIADSGRKVWLVTSDGSCLEGVVHETMRIARHHCPNLKAFCIYNGHGAYGDIYARDLPFGTEIINVDESRYPSWMQGINGHYVVLDKAKYEELMA